MTREFIMTPEFDKCWKNMGLNDDDLRKLQEMILKDPNSGDVVQGTGGLRKLRFALEDGKRGGARVLYIDLVLMEEVYLITAYPKGKKENLTIAEKTIIKKMIEQLKQSAKDRRLRNGI